MGIHLPADTGRLTAAQKCYQSMIPWIARKLEDNINIVSDLNDQLFKDKNSNLGRLFSSTTYAFKAFLHSTMTVFHSPEGSGFECGLFGIPLHDRAVLIGDNVLAHHPRLDEGFTIQVSQRAGVDLLIPMPSFSVWGQEKIATLITTAGTNVSFYYIRQ